MANTFLSQNEIEAALGGFFPTIYTDLYGALYKSTKDANISILDKIPMSEAIQSWSRSYLARNGTREQETDLDRNMTPEEMLSVQLN